MKVLDLTFPTPAENLAADEALLDWCDAMDGPELLRFWEPRELFVVVGYANKVATEVRADACAQSQVPILRRCSGGGTVLQGPGVLNYSLILKIVEGTPTANITSANQFIMERNRAAVAAEFQIPNSKFQISVSGHTDLALHPPHSAPGTLQKFSGNAQRRKRSHLLFHGTFLLNFDLPLVEKFLAMPSLEPDYRNGRSHTDFITNLPLTSTAVKQALCNAWSAAELLTTYPQAPIQSLAHDRYATNEWNFKF
jgi:lipoate-protein ligase A